MGHDAQNTLRRTNLRQSTSLIISAALPLIIIIISVPHIAVHRTYHHRHCVLAAAPVYYQVIHIRLSLDIPTFPAVDVELTLTIPAQHRGTVILYQPFIHVHLIFPYCPQFPLPLALFMTILTDQVPTLDIFCISAPHWQTLRWTDHDQEPIVSKLRQIGSHQLSVECEGMTSTMHVEGSLGVHDDVEPHSVRVHGYCRY